MATIGHLAVGLAAARLSHSATRPRWPAIIGWSALSLLPDADYIAVALGAEDGGPWDHRGITHSFVFAIVAVVGIALATSRLTRATTKTALLATVVITSHSLIDITSYGGVGCALFWPFDPTRYLAPWELIPSAASGASIVSAQALVLALLEALTFAPLLVYAWRPPTAQTALRPRTVVYVAAWFTLIWIARSPR